MPHELRDPAYLWDMLDAARSIRRFTANVALDEYLRNEMMQLAVERQLMVIGEAARRVSENFRQSHPELSLANAIFCPRIRGGDTRAYLGGGANSYSDAYWLA